MNKGYIKNKDYAEPTSKLENRTIVLARPTYSGVYDLFKSEAESEIVPPMGLAYIAAVIRDGSYAGDVTFNYQGKSPNRWNPIILDNEIYKDSPEKFAQRESGRFIINNN